MAYPEALKDCETCISLDPSFGMLMISLTLSYLRAIILIIIPIFTVKAYIRKAAVEFLKKEYTKCLETCETALKHDKDDQHAVEINKQMAKCREAIWQSNSIGSQESAEEALRKAASDPEIMVCISLTLLFVSYIFDDFKFKFYLSSENSSRSCYATNS